LNVVSVSLFGAGQISEAVADEGEAEDQQRDRQSWKQP
jgi:hypothetical protein